MKTVYLASKYSSQARMRDVRTELEKRGFKVNSHWLDLEEGDYPKTLEERNTPEWKERARREAMADLRDVLECNIFIIDTQDESNTGGREVEFGYAMANFKQVFLIGPIRNVFHEHGEHYDTWAEFLDMVDANANRF